MFLVSVNYNNPDIEYRLHIDVDTVYCVRNCEEAGNICSFRVKKLRGTLVAVQQLDKNMNSLRSWLGHIETELSRPIVYDTCDYQEIQRKLDLQQVPTLHTRCI